MLWCAYRDDTKVVWDSHGMVVIYQYDSNTGEWERQPDETRPEWASDLYGADLQAEDEHDGETTDIDDATQDRLRDLGYL